VELLGGSVEASAEWDEDVALVLVRFEGGNR
jgi:hypothetical protein